MSLTLVATAAAIGVVVGLTGMGGGALMTPVLITFFGVPPLTAVSSDIVAAAAMKPAGSFVHWRAGTVNWALVRWLVVGSVPAAFAGVLLVRYGLDTDSFEVVLRRALGVALLLAAAGLSIRAFMRLREHARERDGVGAPLPRERPDVTVRPWLTLAIGAVGGLIVGTTSVGSGSLMIIALMATYPMLRASQLVGTDLMQAVPLVVAAALAHIAFGDVDWPLTLAIIAGSIPGTIVGSLLSSRLSGGVIRRALAVVLLVAAVKMLGADVWTTLGAGVAALLTGTVAWALLRRHYGFSPFVWQARGSRP